MGYGRARERLTPRAFGWLLALVVGTDLWLNATQFWRYSPDPRTELFRPDSITSRIREVFPPERAGDRGRVLDLGVYPGNGVTLMAFDIPQVLGHHGNELRYYDELLGGKNEWRNLSFVHLWDLLAVRYALTPSGPRSADSIPGFKRVLDSVPTSAGTRATLFERTEVPPYARVVPGAVKTDSSVIVSTLVDPRMDYSRLVLFAMDQPVTPVRIREMPPPSPSRATLTFWQPGRMTIALAPPPPQESYVVVAENWYPDWHAAVDGAPAQLLRGDHALLTVRVPAGAKQVELTFRSKDYETGRAISLVSLALLVTIAAGPLAFRRKQDA